MVDISVRVSSFLENIEKANPNPLENTIIKSSKMIDIIKDL